MLRSRHQAHRIVNSYRVGKVWRSAARTALQDLHTKRVAILDLRLTSQRKLSHQSVIAIRFPSVAVLRFGSRNILSGHVELRFECSLVTGLPIIKLRVFWLYVFLTSHQQNKTCEQE